MTVPRRHRRVTRRTATRSESSEQKALVHWATLQARTTYPELALLYAVANGGRRDVITGARLKAEGVRPGVPDLCLPVARGPWHGLYIELKASGGHVSAVQREWIAALNAQQYHAVVCVGWQAAADTITAYLRGGA